MKYEKEAPVIIYLADKVEATQGENYFYGEH